MPKHANPEPDPQLAAPTPEAAGDPGPLYLDPAAAEWAPKGNTQQPGSRVEKPGMANFNVKGTRLLGQVAKARGMGSTTPLAVLVSRDETDVYYLTPTDPGTTKAADVKYSKSNRVCHVDLFPYLYQSGLVVPTDHHWFVPAKFDDKSKYAPSLRLDFTARENLPITKLGPRKRQPPSPPQQPAEP